MALIEQFPLVRRKVVWHIRVVVLPTPEAVGRPTGPAYRRDRSVDPSNEEVERANRIVGDQRVVDPL
jgi:hypothetical protein